MKYLLLIALIACASAGDCIGTEDEAMVACKEHTDVMEDPDWGTKCFADETCMADLTNMGTASDAMTACSTDNASDECAEITCIVAAMNLQYADISNLFNCMRDQCCFGTLSKFAYSLLLLFVLSFMK